MGGLVSTLGGLISTGCLEGNKDAKGPVSTLAHARIRSPRRPAYYDVVHNGKLFEDCLDLSEIELDFSAISVPTSSPSSY
jgi:hypothetical protein